MKLLTRSLTTKNPLTNPATAHAPRATNMPHRSGIVSLLAERSSVITSDIDIIGPIDRS